MGNIKAIIIYSMMNPFNKNRRIHYGVMDKFKNLCKDCHIYTVGDDIPSLTKVNAEKIYKRHKPDVFITYDGRIKTRKHYIGDATLKNIPCKKISICNDLPDKKDRNNYTFFYKNGFDLVFQRGTFVFEDLDIPSVWLPYSADENVFNLDIKNKNNKVGIAATYNPKVYIQRKKIMRILKRKKLLSLCDRPCKRYPEKYIQFLCSLKVGVTSVETKDENFTTPKAKMFEYLASKTAVLTPSFTGIDNLFTEEYNKYIEVFDYENLVKKAEKLLNNNEYRNKMIKNAYDLFLEQHTDQKRAEEMYLNVLNLLEGREIIKKWGR